METSNQRDIITTRTRECSILVTSLLVVASVVVALSYNVHMEAQTTPAKQPNKQAQISNASSAKNTNATAAIAAPPIGSTQQLSKALGNKISLSTIASHYAGSTQNKISGTSNLTKSTSPEGKNNNKN
jgi:hypothetical protein